MKQLIGKRKTYDCPTCRQTLPSKECTKNFWIIQNLPALLQQRKSAASSSKRGPPPPTAEEAVASRRTKKPRTERRKTEAEALQAGAPVAAAVGAAAGAAAVHVDCNEVVGEIDRMTVRGGAHAVVSRILQGIFKRNGQEHHGRPVYVKENDSLSGVFVYYWDTRDGPNWSGWWFGPVVGGASYWAYHPSSSAQTPPRSGWKIAGGEVDPTVVLGPAPPRSEEAQQAHQGAGRTPPLLAPSSAPQRRPLPPPLVRRHAAPAQGAGPQPAPSAAPPRRALPPPLTRRHAAPDPAPPRPPAPPAPRQWHTAPPISPPFRSGAWRPREVSYLNGSRYWWPY
ncbi:unnamed protein product [Symbiodinium sp. KB8]|nr:unnamed protein product [Symbiodinium sp. KB8]